jgi:hypothetical protein
MPRCNFEITDSQDAQIETVSKRGLTRSQVVQLALMVGLPAVDRQTRDGVIEWVGRALRDGERESIKKPRAKRRS